MSPVIKPKLFSKRCVKCGDVLPIARFTKSKVNKDGYEYTCRQCVNKHNKQREVSLLYSCIRNDNEGNKQ